MKMKVDIRGVEIDVGEVKETFFTAEDCQVVIEIMQKLDKTNLLSLPVGSDFLTDAEWKMVIRLTLVGFLAEKGGKDD
jgi:hypothetical protein